MDTAAIHGEVIEEAYLARWSAKTCAPDGEAELNLDGSQPVLPENVHVSRPLALGEEAPRSVPVVITWCYEDPPIRGGEGVPQKRARPRAESLVLVEIAGTENGIGLHLFGEIDYLPQRIAERLPATASHIPVGPAEGGIEMQVGEDHEAHGVPLPPDRYFLIRRPPR